jgi:hypothetical protein
MEDFEEGEGLGPFQEREEGFEETLEFGVGVEGRDEEGGAESDCGPEHEAETVV